MRMRYSPGAAISLFGHGALLAALMWPTEPLPPPSMATVEMSMSIPALESADAASTPDVVTTAVKPPDAVRDPPPETIHEAKAVQDVAEIAPEATAPDVVAEVEPEPELIETQAVEPPVVISARPRPRPVASAPPPPKPVATVAPPAPSPAPAETPTTSPPTNDPATVAAHAAAAPRAAVGPSPDYLANLRAWLEKHKTYPSHAQRRRQQGTALLRFTISRDGRVLAHHIERSSGIAVLDAAVEDMIERAEPLPPLPPEMTQDTLEIVVPVAFLLR